MKYRKKPVVVEAVQWFKHGDHPAVREIRGYRDWGIIGPIEGNKIVATGDWIITWPTGDIYVCADAIFRATYEEVKE